MLLRRHRQAKEIVKPVEETTEVEVPETENTAETEETAENTAENTAEETTEVENTEVKRTRKKK